MAPDPHPAPVWRRLQLSRRTKPKPPPLFYKFITQAPASSTSSPQLVLHCTDLTVIYTATLSRVDILAEATRQHSPIDPSESSKQLNVLLDYLSQSLAGKENVLTHTHRTSNNDDDETSLTLRTAIALPRPLRPLIFDFGLARQPAEAFSRVVLRPALQATHVAHRKLAALTDVVADKDHVIARLLDYVGGQASGDMSLVFPTLTGRRGRAGEKVGVEEAARHVPGLQQFDLRAWERVQGFGQLEDEGGAEGLVLDGLTEKGGEDHGNWAEQLPGLDVLEASGSAGGRLSRQVTRESTKGSLGEDDDDDDDATESEDEFERQPTPPSARKTAQRKTSPRPSAMAPEQSGEDPASSGQDDGPPPSKKQKTSGEGTKRARKLGGLGRNRRAASKPSQELSPERDTASPPAVDNRRRPSTASTATATASEAEASQPPTTRSSKKQGYHEHSNQSSPVQPQPAKASQLGNGSSNKRKPSPATPPTASPSPEPEPAQSESSVTAKPGPSETPAKKGGRRLGRLATAGRRSKTRTPPFVEPPDAQRQQDEESAAASPPPPPARSPATAAAAVAEEEENNNDSGAPRRLGKLGLRRKKAGGAAPAVESESDDGGEELDLDLDLDAPGSPRRDTAEDGGRGLAEQSGAEAGGTPVAASGRGRGGSGGKQEKGATTDYNKNDDEEETETVEQAAARRREELKRTAAAAPARKKRRF